jgi:Tfp pilus assembly protein PilN
MPTRRINLLPPELAQRKRARQILSSLGAGGIALILALGLVYGLQAARLASERHRLEVQEERNDELQAKIAQLAAVDRSQRLLKQRQELLASLTKSEVRWSTVLSDVSLVIPSDAWLTTFTGTVNIVADDSEGAQVLGSITLNGVTFSHVDVAKWLTRLSSVEQFTFPYLSLSQKGTIGDTLVVNFNSSVQLSEASFRRNQRGAERDV